MASMTFLELVQRTYRESGLAGSGPSSVLNQTGRNGDAVNCVLAAHEEIQSARPDWSFDWADGNFTLTANDDTYDPTSDLGIVGGVREFIRTPTASYIYPTASGVNARLFLCFTPWEQFRGLLAPVVTGNLPTRFSLRPDGDVQYWPKPTVACTAHHEYQRNVEVMDADADIPRMPAWSHMAIVWKAVMLLADRTKDWSRQDTAEERFYRVYQRMLEDCTPQLTLGAPLA